LKTIGVDILHFKCINKGIESTLSANLVLNHTSLYPSSYLILFYIFFIKQNDKCVLLHFKRLTKLIKNTLSFKASYLISFHSNFILYYFYNPLFIGHNYRFIIEQNGWCRYITL